METKRKGSGPSASRATLALVAGEAEVSLSTVSKVLNARPGVSTATRSRIEELLSTHGYHRRGTERPHGHLVELVFEDIDSVWSLEIIRGVESVARANGMSVVLTETNQRLRPAEGWFSAMLQRRPVGVILVFSDLPEAQRLRMHARRIPFVQLDPAGDPAPDVPAIGSTNFAGGLAAARHLVELGHRRIGVMTGPDDLMSARARLAGFRSGLEDAGVELDPRLVLTGDFRFETGRRLARRLLDRRDRPSAVFAGNDQQAFGLYETARDLGLDIPGDVSVVGYDDVPPARWVGPPLTTVRQPLMDMAEEATRLILKLDAQPDATATRLDLATSFVVRGSTASAPS